MHYEKSSVWRITAESVAVRIGHFGYSVGGRLSNLMSGLADRTILYQNGRIILVNYGLLVSVGSVFWMYITGACLLAHGLTPRQTAFFLVGGTLAALFASRLFWWLEHLPSLWQQPMLGIRKVGYVSWGGITGVFLFALGFSAAYSYPLLAAGDDVLRGLFVAYALGRIGCLTYGCCYGKGSGRYGVRYRNSNAKVVREKGLSSDCRYPTQMYSCFEGIVLFLFLNAIPYYEVAAGVLTALSFLIYPIGRACIESFRDRRRYWGHRFTVGQLECAVMFGCGWLLLCYAIDFSSRRFAPVPFSISQLSRALSLAPILIISGIIVFFSTGFHWKRVGTW
jgi:prolipoprotein diacylglyceryltransferase